MSIEESRIPVPSPGVFRRSASMRLRGERRISPISESGPSDLSSIGFTPATRHRSLSVSSSHHRPHSLSQEVMEDDVDSLKSFGSVGSAMSCDHAYFARNGTTFSGRRMKYVVHCSPHNDGTDEYLTPTQRANRQIKRLKTLLVQAEKDLEQKDQDIMRLTKEVVELRLYKAALDMGTPANQSSDETDGKETDESERKEPEPIAGTSRSNLLDSTTCDLPSSLADSGHFEDIATSSVHSKDSLTLPHSPALRQSVLAHKDIASGEDREGERTRIVTMYEKRLEEMQRNHVDECQEMKERHNDKVENLLQRLSDVNNRYCELRAEYDSAQDKIRELERDTETLRKSMEEQEDRHKSMYLKMYMKGQEAAKFEHADQVLEFAHQAPARVSVPELLQQLQVTENELENIKAMYRRIMQARTGKGEMDPEITLQFLKSAIYYFLTDKENHQGHLNAIESILGYSENERLNIERAYKK